MLKPFLAILSRGRSLARKEAAEAMGIIMDGGAGEPQIAAFAMALRVKGETAGEILGCAEALRARAERVLLAPAERRELLDTCGTGGDSLGTINVSTLAALAAAAAGVPVAKHGNRAVSGRCGSADLLEALGVPIDAGPGQARDCLRTAGIAFLFAPRFHPALRHAASARRALGVRTVFNLLGPLCNPAGARLHVMGIFDPSRARMVAEVLRRLGSRRAFIVHGSDGMDELTVTGPSLVTRLDKGAVRTTHVTPESAGLRRWPLAALRGGGPAENASRALAVLEGGRGAARDVTLLNAAAGLVVAGAARSLREGAALAAEAIDRGLAGEKLEALRRGLAAPVGGAS
ncbi:MAG TPA: anthranilate phosphoribosyltransferase [Candidatus Polarisedimenticolia bacterium]|nr:anthranilate phosphoribosyltransferase [Candidatus Polarisedimenticolia bacterium]